MNIINLEKKVHKLGKNDWKKLIQSKLTWQMFMMVSWYINVQVMTWHVTGL